MRFDLAYIAMCMLHTELVKRNVTITVRVEEVTDHYITFEVGDFNISTKDGKMWSVMQIMPRLNYTPALRDIELSEALDRAFAPTKTK